MNKLKLILLTTVVLGAGLSAGCRGGSSQPQSGFRVQGQKYVQVFGGGFSLVSAANVQGAHQFDNGNAVGNTRSFGPFLCLGPCPVNDGRVPARWRILAGLGGECVGQITNPDMDVSSGQTKTAQCLVSGLIFPFNAAQASVNLQAPPPTVELTGSGLDTTYGMPHIEYFDGYSGQVVGSTDATSVSADGSWLQSPTPDLSQVYSGTYNILISNRQADGSLNYVGTSSLNGYGRDEIYEPPPEPCQPTYQTYQNHGEQQQEQQLQQPVCY